MTICEVENCKGLVRSNGLCNKHYYRKYRYGDVEAVSVIIGDDKARLKSHVIILDSGCWQWVGSQWNGYGKVSLKGKNEQAHRASWMVFNGSIGDSLQVNHKCHNRACINPDHLYLGTQNQNMEDMRGAGRENKAFGEGNGNSFLVESDVIEIKKMIADGFSYRVISEKFNTCITNIGSIKRGLTWSHVEI